MNPETGRFHHEDEARAMMAEMALRAKDEGRTNVPVEWPRLGIGEICEVRTPEGRTLRMQVWEIKGRKVVMRSLPISPAAPEPETTDE